MRNKAIIVSIVFILSLFIFIVSCRQQKSTWKGTIEEVNGVTVVKNPKEPIHDEGMLSLNELSTYLNLYKSNFL